MSHVPGISKRRQPVNGRLQHLSKFIKVGQDDEEDGEGWESEEGMHNSGLIAVSE